MSDGSRRVVLKAAIGLGLGWTLESRAHTQQDEGATARPQEGDLLVKAGDSNKTPLAPHDVLGGVAQTMAWAMEPATRTVRSGSRLNQILLIRLDPEKLTATTRSRAADGVLAYTSICPHTGCDVDEWSAADQLLSCPCHFSLFDPKDGGRVVDGPAPRALPALPLKIVEGTLMVAKPFTARIAFEKG